MKALQAFFFLVARPAMLVWFLFWIAAVGLMTAVMTDPKFIAAPTDVLFARVLAFPLVVGLLSGLAIQELQHCWFASTLPDVRRKTSFGFVVAGIGFTSIVVALQSVAGSAHGLWSLLSIGFAAFCLGGIASHPRHREMTLFFIAVAAIAWLGSAQAGTFCASHQAVAIVGSLSFASLALWLRFGEGSFRRLPFHPRIELAGTFSMKHSAQTAREKLARRKQRKRPWREGSMGSNTGAWVRAGFYESTGGLGWSDIPRLAPPVLMLVAMVALNSLSRERIGPWYRAISDSLWLAIFNPPGVDARSQHVLVIFLVAVIGLFSMAGLTSSLDPRRHYPLSRRDLARVTFWFHAAATAASLALVGITLAFIGTVAGAVAGRRLELIFVPNFVRAILVTAITLPVATWVWLRIRINLRNAGYPTVLMGGMAFVALVWFLTFLSSSILVFPAGELAFLAIALVASQLLYRRRLADYFATEDLVS